MGCYKFDLFDYSMKDFSMGMLVIRYDNIGFFILSPPSTTIPSNSVALSSILWHNQLGDLQAQVLHYLRKNKFIESKNFNCSFVCESCVIGKYGELSFYVSNLWTSLPTLSFVGHKYYILLLDDYTDFLWTFPIGRKSQPFSVSCLLVYSFTLNLK